MRQIALVVALAVTAAGLPLQWLIQRETRAAADAMQAVEAAKASAQIDRFTGAPTAMLRASLALLDGHCLSKVYFMHVSIRPQPQ